ncbi:helix-turn-helix transcriptional regulator [Terrarubrum flagellatum]|uniref:helix-turn-helix transcriptional regulator n=1 Tax=Terrirubrum flagellatum TaxID=2895980 RepID=UPI0031456D68
MTQSFEVDLKDLLHGLRTEEVLSFQQVRGSLDQVVSSRTSEYRRIEDGVIASIFDHDIHAPYRLRTIRRKHVSFTFVRDGGYSIQLGPQLYSTKPAMARMTIAAESIAQHTAQEPHQKLGGLTVFIDQECLIERFGLDFDRFPDDFRALRQGDESVDFSMEVPLPPWSWIAMDQVLDCRFAEPMRSTYLRAKIIEMVCEAVTYVNLIDKPANNFRVPAARREQTRIETAALIYRREMRCPPSLRELAQRLGLNRNKLNDGFREMFGMTPHEYLRRLRLEWAHNRISAGAMSISEACEAVGYASHSAFTRAYGELFGYAPSETPGATLTRKKDD